MRPVPSDERRQSDVPLAVDLDGTLTPSDTLHEGFAQWIRHDPFGFHAIVKALSGGRAAFKREVAKRSEFDAQTLPYNTELLVYLREAKQSGRRIGLFTAADQSIADAVADHLSLFDVARGSDGNTNLRGTEKVRAIQESLGPDFAYAGNEARDQPIFAESRQVILVGAVQRLRTFLKPEAAVEAEFPVRSAGFRDWIGALRLKHWPKNILVFVGPVLGGQLTISVALQALLLFVLLSVLASATYLVNDIFDITADRQHPTKRHRALAAGKIPVAHAVAVAGAMIVLAFAAALLLPPSCFIALLAYLGLTLAYSFLLKSQPIVDVVLLAGLFTLRVLAGSWLVAAPTSPWLLTFSMMFFLGLAMIKRYAELDRTVGEGGSGVQSRGYTARDLPLLLSAGVASGFVAISVLVIYLINEHYPRAIYATPEFLWALTPVILLWTLRMWHLTVHGRMDEDPVAFALKDRFSLISGVVVAVILFLAWT